MADKFVLLLSFSSGIIEPVPLSTEALTDDQIIIAIDEINECVWIWQGASTSMIERRAAQRKARSIVTAGYQMGRLRVGRDVDRVEIIDGEYLDDPESKQAYELLLATLNQPFTITDKVLGRYGNGPPPKPSTATVAPTVSKPVAASTTSAAIPAPTTAPTPTPSPAQAPARSTKAVTISQPISARTTQTETVPEDVAPLPSRSIKDLGVIRVGILIASIIDHFPLCYVSVTRTEEFTRYTIEDPEGVICELDVVQDSVQFLERYDFRGKRNEILSLLRDRLTEVDL